MALKGTATFPVAVCLLPGSCSQGRRCALPRTPSHSPASGWHGERVPQAPRGNHRADSPPVAKPARKLFQTKVRLQTAAPPAPVAPLPTPAPSTPEKRTFQLRLDTRIDITVPLGDDGSDTTAHSCSVVASAATSTVHHSVATSPWRAGRVARRRWRRGRRWRRRLPDRAPPGSRWSCWQSRAVPAPGRCHARRPRPACGRSDQDADREGQSKANSPRSALQQHYESNPIHRISAESLELDLPVRVE